MPKKNAVEELSEHVATGPAPEEVLMQTEDTLESQAQVAESESVNKSRPAVGDVVHYIDGFTRRILAATVAGSYGGEILDLVVFDPAQNPPVFTVRGAARTMSSQSGHWTKRDT